MPALGRRERHQGNFRTTFVFDVVAEGQSTQKCHRGRVRNALRPLAGNNTNLGDVPKDRNALPRDSVAVWCEKGFSWSWGIAGLGANLALTGRSIHTPLMSCLIISAIGKTRVRPILLRTASYCIRVVDSA
jgi:hypothetical protein